MSAEEKNSTKEEISQKSDSEEKRIKNTASEESGSKTDETEESNNEEDGADRSVVEEEYAENNDYLVREIVSHLVDVFDEEVEYNLLTDQIKNEVVEITMNGKIRFRQLINKKVPIRENCENAQGSYERNLRVYEKLSTEYMTKHGQEIMFMDQAEVKSIKTVKEVEKPTK